jgi:hypothetical protein
MKNDGSNHSALSLTLFWMTNAQNALVDYMVCDESDKRDQAIRVRQHLQDAVWAAEDLGMGLGES